MHGTGGLELAVGGRFADGVAPMGDVEVMLACSGMSRRGDHMRSEAMLVVLRVCGPRPSAF